MNSANFPKIAQCLVGPFIFALATLMTTSPTHAAETDFRRTLNFNRDWRFHLGDPSGAESVGYDDVGWQTIGLPHSFSIPYFLSPDFYVGYGWYRKRFDVPESHAGKRLFLEFEAAFQDAEIFVNGRRVGGHQGGYTGFAVDITDAARPGGANLVAVRLNNLWNPRLAPRAGEHTFSGGLYRNVFLVVTDPLHVAWCGTSVTTPQVSKDSAVVRVRTDVVNASGATKSATVRHRVLDPDGDAVVEIQSTQSVPAGATVSFDQTCRSIPNPKLWHPDHPHLYTVQTTVLDDGRPVDRSVAPLGFRWFEWMADRGFFLNGEHLYLRGANVHQDHAGWGDAVTDAGLERDVRLMKQAGFNFIRGSHYPHAPAFSAACDRLGILFWSENAFWGIGGFRPDGYWNASAYPPRADDRSAFEASARQQLEEMIRIHRNHPSIIAWSMSNEPFFTEPATIPRMKAFLAKLVTYARELDPTRPAAVGGVQRPLDENRIDLIGDLAGYNGDGAEIAIFQNPGVPSVVSEYGSTTADRPGAFDPGWGSLTVDGGRPVHAWRSGQAIWCGFDHGSIAGARFGKMGIVDYFRIPKRAWFWYREAYANVPPPAWPAPGKPARLKLDADKATGVRTDGTDDVMLTVTVLDAAGTPISNSPPVVLSVVSGPGEFPTGPSIAFAERDDIRILDGQAAIEFRSYYAGPTVIRATSPGLEPAEATIQFDGPLAYVAGTTPPARPRPYVRYEKPARPVVEQRFGRDNPTFASSAAADHPAGLATDGKAGTYWKPAAGDKTPTWTLDLEKFVAVSQVTIGFPVEGVYHFRIDVSDDRKHWRLLADRTQNQTRESRCVLAPQPGARGRFVRISFAADAAASEPGLTAVEVLGTLTDR